MMHTMFVVAILIAVTLAQNAPLNAQNLLSISFNPDPTVLSGQNWYMDTDGTIVLVLTYPTYQEYYDITNVNDRILLANITGLNSCRGGPFISKRTGDNVVHLADPDPLCNCVAGKVCEPQLNINVHTASVNLNVSYCDTAGIQSSAKNYSAVAILTVPDDACTNITNNITGKIAVIRRGACSFQTKYDYAKAAGAIGAVVINSNGTVGCEGMEATALPPYIQISYADGENLVSYIMSNATVVLSLGTEIGMLYQPGVFGELTQYITIIPFGSTNSSAITVDESLRNGYLLGQTQEENIPYLLTYGQDDTNDAFVLNPNGYATLRIPPAQEAINMPYAAMFSRAYVDYYTAPDFLNGFCNIYLVQSGNLVSQVPFSQCGTCIADPTSSFMYVGSDTIGPSAGIFAIYDIGGTNVSAPVFVRNFTIEIPEGAGKEQQNQANFVTQNGVTLGCFAMTSEGGFVIDFTDPGNPNIIATFDQDIESGDYQIGTQYCAPHVVFGQFWLFDTTQGIAQLVQVVQYPGQSSTSTSTSTSISSSSSSTSSTSSSSATSSSSSASSSTSSNNTGSDTDNTGTGTGTESESESSSSVIFASVLIFSLLLIQ